MNTTKLTALFMALAVTLSIAGFTYAHWTDTVQIEGTAKMAHIRMTIESEKVLTPKEIEKYSEVTYKVSTDKHTLEIHCTNLKPCWYIWVGLVLQNTGTLTANVKAPVYSYHPSDGFEDYFETEEYLYGHYPESPGPGKLEVWGDVTICEDLLPNGTVTFEETAHTTFTAEPLERGIIWIWIHCRENTPNSLMGETVTLYITIVDDPFYA